MIVRNEAPVVRRGLDAARDIIDRWVVVDTGSSDGTQEIVRDALRDLPGELYERPWRDFASNRSEALSLARDRGDYTLILDADDVLQIPSGFRIPDLLADSYTIDIDHDGFFYRRPALVKASLPWRYIGVLHEYLHCEGSRTREHLQVVLRLMSDGARRRDPRTFHKDVAVLENALNRETDPFLRSRYTFYLANSYRDCGESRKAVDAYMRRADMGFWNEEIFVSLAQAGRIRERLGDDPEEVLQLYRRASDACVTRAEALYDASRLCRTLGLHQRGYAFAREGIEISFPTEGLFAERWIYDYGTLDEYAVNAFWTGRFWESLDGSLRALASDQVSVDDRLRIVANARLALARLPRGQMPMSDGLQLHDSLR